MPKTSKKMVATVLVLSLSRLGAAAFVSSPSVRFGYRALGSNSKMSMSTGSMSESEDNMPFYAPGAAGVDYIAEFLDCNDEAIVTESGLVYCPMEEGSGAQPTVADTVEVHYHGTFISGEVVDSSVDRGQTMTFPLGNVIKGWQEGLAMMREGGKATLVIPSDLAYGEVGVGDIIQPGAMLKFEVELIKVLGDEIEVDFFN